MTLLTEPEVRRIRFLYEEGVPLPLIAAEFGLKERRALEAATGQIKGIPVSPASLAVRPGCMMPDEFTEWQRFNRAQNYREQASDPCVDCLGGFAADVRAKPINLCDGTPGGVEDDDEPLPEPLPVVESERPTGRASAAVKRQWQDPDFRRRVGEGRRRASARRRAPLKAKIAEMRAEGWAWTRIGMELGMSPSTAVYYLNGRRAA